MDALIDDVLKALQMQEKVEESVARFECFAMGAISRPAPPTPRLDGPAVAEQD